MAWTKLIGIDGEIYHVNIDHIAFIRSQEGRSLITFASRSDHGSIGMLAVRAQPDEILKGETISS